MKSRKLSAGFPFICILIALFVLCACPVFADAEEKVVYVTDGGTGDGSTADTAFGSLADAYAALGDAGGRIVVMEKLTLTEHFNEPKHTGTVTLTQEYGGVSYRTAEGHGIVSNKHRFFLNGPTVFENLTFRGNGDPAGQNFILIVAQFNPIEMGMGVRCEDFGDYEAIAKAAVIVGGVQKDAGTAATALPDSDSQITVKSGKFNIVAHSRSVSCSGTAYVDIYGGTIHRLHMGSVNGGVGGNVWLNIYGGTFTSKLLAVDEETSTNMQGDLKITVSGGDFSSVQRFDGTVTDGVSLIDISAFADREALAGKLTGFGTVVQDAAASTEKTEIKMTIGDMNGYVNGVAKALDAAPIIRQNRTMLPVRFVAENLGASVAWDGATSTATLTSGDIEIKITIGAATATVNGEEKPLDAPAFIENSRTYLPVRFVAEALGAAVAWDGATSTATITK